MFLSSLEVPYVNERKLSGDARLATSVRALLDARCLPDGEYPVGRVNSLYFDTVGLSAYREKADGDHLKRKVRLRWYGLDGDLPESVPAFLEVKYRVGSARHKVRQRLEVPRSLLLETPFGDDSFRTFLARNGAAVGEPLAAEWTPVVQISYDRHRYVDVPSDSRVSVDWNIVAPRFHPERFPLGHPVALDEMVCEYKNEGGTPPAWLDELRLMGLRHGSFSKYGACMERLTEGLL